MKSDSFFYKFTFDYIFLTEDSLKADDFVSIRFFNKLMFKNYGQSVFSLSMGNTIYNKKLVNKIYSYTYVFCGKAKYFRFGIDLKNHCRVGVANFKLSKINNILEVKNMGTDIKDMLIEQSLKNACIKDKIKVVFWDLDDTLWTGTLAENDDVKLNPQIVQIIKTLTDRGIINSICSKNDYNLAKKKLQNFNIWDLFVFNSISFNPKGESIKNTLKSMGLRDNNALFIDDNIVNLKEVEFYNKNISVLHVDHCTEILNNPNMQGKNDFSHQKLQQYKQLEEKNEVSKKFSSNELFLQSCNIKIDIIPYTSSYFDRVYELSEKTNQLNFTKIRMKENELKNLLNNKLYTTCLVHVVDNFGDYGIIGFYTIFQNKLIHYVFSCRCMNMGIEQWIYAYLNYPEISIVGDVASEIGSSIKTPNWISLQSESYNLCDDISSILDNDSLVKIFGIGACDLYNTIAHLAMVNHKFIFECNVFKGNERGVNVGTEYIRSTVELTDEEKLYCRQHFYNYTGSLAFNSKIFSEEYDYIIMSFHDDMVFYVYQSKQNPRINVLLSPEELIDGTTTTSVIGKNGKPLSKNEQQKWLKENFTEGKFITVDRFKENLLFIKSKLSVKTKVILITGPELDFFRTKIPKIPQIREQIIKINNAIKDFARENSEQFAVVDINKHIKTKDDITDYIFHLKAYTSYNLFTDIVWTIVRNFKNNRGRMLSSKIKEREIVIFGSGLFARNCFYNLVLGNQRPRIYVDFDYLDKCVGTIAVQNPELLANNIHKYFVIVADNDNTPKIINYLKGFNYKENFDFTVYCNGNYKKKWQEDSL